MASDPIKRRSDFETQQEYNDWVYESTMNQAGDADTEYSIIDEFGNSTTVDATTYAAGTTPAVMLRRKLKEQGWSDAEADQYVAQIYDPNYDVNEWDNGDGDPEDICILQPGDRPAFETECAQAAADAQAEQQLDKIISDSARAAAEENDWRVRLHLAEDAKYLYNDNNPGILEPLRETKGIIFPYTPQIAVQYNADYENYDLVHSNYRGYFYKGSQVQNIILTATFTANDVAEANYMLAAMHFLRSATKMFYGQDQQRGMPPPVVFLTGLGEYQFNNHPCAITSVNYNLPNDVDYIPCGKPEGVAPIDRPSSQEYSTPGARLRAAQLAPGARPQAKEADPFGYNATNNGVQETYSKATYVPTKIDINFTMIPIQTRDQVSKEFSLKEYASGSLLTKGFW